MCCLPSLRVFVWCEDIGYCSCCSYQAVLNSLYLTRQRKGVGGFFVILDLVLVRLVRGKKRPVYNIKTVPSEVILF